MIHTAEYLREALMYTLFGATGGLLARPYLDGRRTLPGLRRRGGRS